MFKDTVSSVQTLIRYDDELEKTLLVKKEFSERAIVKN